MAKILITGGSGMLGTYLSELLAKENHEVLHLSRSERPNAKFKTFVWDTKRNFIQDGALENCDYIIHLAGEGIANKKWTNQQKEILLHSRVDGPKFLLQKIKDKKISLKGFFSASGINYYGSATSDNIYTEEDGPANEFISAVVVEWEKTAQAFSEICRVVCFRFGLVLDKKEGGLAKIAKPIKFGFGAAIGSGKQWMTWIHKHDAAMCFVYAINTKTVSGIYNAIADEHVNNTMFTKTLAKVLHRPLWLPKIPAFLIRLVFGELSVLVLEGSRASNKKLKDAGFEFQFPKLIDALKDIYN